MEKQLKKAAVVKNIKNKNGNIIKNKKKTGWTWS